MQFSTFLESYQRNIFSTFVSAFTKIRCFIRVEITVACSSDLGVVEATSFTDDSLEFPMTNEYLILLLLPLKWKYAADP